MADTNGLRLLGLIFGGITVAVVLMAGASVYAHVGGAALAETGSVEVQQGAIDR